MEGVPYYPENSSDDEEGSKAEKKDKKELTKKPSLLELLQGGEDKPEKQAEATEDDKKESDPTDDAEAEPAEEQLDDTEQKVVAEQIIDDRLEQVESEIETAVPGSKDESAAMAAATFLEKIGSKVDNGEQLDEQALDEATAEAADELGIPLEEISHEDAEEATVDAEPEAEEPAESEPPVEPDDDDTTVLPPTPTAVTPPSSTPPPPQPAVPAAPTLPIAAPVPPIAPAARFNTLTTPGTKEDEDSHGHSHLKYVLAGGLLGYLLGRRRGRIKTEKRLLPIQEKLEKQVSSMQEALLKREETIRRLGARHRQELSDVSRAQTQELVKRERAKRADTLKIYEKGVHQRPEKIGKFALLPNSTPERPKHIETLSDQQLFETAKDIEMNGVSLESLYKQGRVELADLKEIVSAFLRGETYEKLLFAAVKPEKLERLSGSNEISSQTAESTGATKLANLLPDIAGVKQPEHLYFKPQKESHIAARVAAVSAAVVAVVVAAILIALVLLGAL